MIYDVIKTDPNFMKNNFKSSSSAIQAMMKDQEGYKNFRKQDEEDDN